LLCHLNVSERKASFSSTLCLLILFASKLFYRCNESHLPDSKPTSLIVRRSWWSERRCNNVTFTCGQVWDTHAEVTFTVKQHLGVIAERELLKGVCCLPQVWKFGKGPSGARDTQCACLNAIKLIPCSGLMKHMMYSCHLCACGTARPRGLLRLL
jgi:hypothetical protein